MSGALPITFQASPAQIVLDKARASMFTSTPVETEAIEPSEEIEVIEGGEIPSVDLSVFVNDVTDLVESYNLTPDQFKEAIHKIIDNVLNPA